MLIDIIKEQQISEEVYSVRMLIDSLEIEVGIYAEAHPITGHYEYSYDIYTAHGLCIYSTENTYFSNIKLALLSATTQACFIIKH